MVEIGSSLRDVRVRRGLELPQVERETRIRGRYLQALEDERFDVLPGAAYAKGFLRTYADYLGLDGQRFVDEYNARFPPSAEMQTAPLVRVRRRRPAFGSWLLGIAVAGLLGLIAWQLSSTGHKPAARSPIPETTTTTRRALLPAPRPVPHAVPSVARIALVATRGPCWFSVRLGSRAGRSLYERTLEQGQSARFTGRRLWIRLGAPWNVDARLNGKAIRLPGAIGNVVVTAAGLVRARS